MRGKTALPLIAALSLLSLNASAGETVSPEMFAINNTWMMVSIFLVFIMHLGFATVETGLTRAKNTVNILFKNTAIVAIGLLTYTLIGFNLMYPGEEFAGGFVGFAGFGLSTDEQTSPSAPLRRRLRRTWMQ